MTGMTERVAKAIYLEFYKGRPNLSFEDEAGLWWRQARAAIEAMREPTDEMADAIWELTGDPCWREDAIRAWKAGIEGALIDAKTLRLPKEAEGHDGPTDMLS